MKFVLPIAAICLLLLSGVRSALILSREVRQYHAALAPATGIPLDSALDGLDASGVHKTPDFDPDEYLKDRGTLVLFVIHHNNLPAEIRYWNSTISSVASSDSIHPLVQYWGICDAGSDCNAYQSTARFCILGYLVPYQMHIAASADTNREALLYGRSGRLKARLPIASAPSAMSRAILPEVRWL